MFQVIVRSQFSGSTGDIMKQIAAEWRELDSYERERYEQQAAQDAAVRQSRIDLWEHEMEVLGRKKEIFEVKRDAEMREQKEAERIHSY